MNRAGLTLIELVVGITIASVLLAAAYAGLTTALDRRVRAVAVMEADLDAASARASLNGWLVGAHTVSESSSPVFSGVDAEIDGLPDDQLTFLTSAETPLGRGRTVVRLYVDRNPDTPVQGLVAEFTAWLGTARRRVELIPEVRGMNVRYRSNLLSGRDWLPSWISSSVMPEAAELSLVSSPDGVALHPLLALPIRVPLRGGR